MSYAPYTRAGLLESIGRTEALANSAMSGDEHSFWAQRAAALREKAGEITLAECIAIARVRKERLARYGEVEESNG